MTRAGRAPVIAGPGRRASYLRTLRGQSAAVMKTSTKMATVSTTPMAIR